MSFDIQLKNGLATLQGQGELTIVQISEFKKKITDIMPDSKEVLVDLLNITDMDVSCLQLLCSANRSFEQNKTPLTRKGNLTDIMKQTLLDAGYDLGTGCPEAPCKNCFWKGDKD